MAKTKPAPATITEQLEDVAPITLRHEDPQVSFDDLKNLLIGPLVREHQGKLYFTLKGKVFVQPMKDGIFSAFCYTTVDNTRPVADLSGFNGTDSDTVTPYKDGIDATLDNGHVEPEYYDTFGKRPRTNLLYDLVDDGTRSEEAVIEQWNNLKRMAQQEQFLYLAQRNLRDRARGNIDDEMRTVGSRVQNGARFISPQDETWDSEFITKGCQFLLKGKFPQRLFGEEDTANQNLLMQIMAGKAIQSDDNPVELSDPNEVYDF